MQKTVSLVLLACFTLSAAELPVRKVLLYKHGIGYFERGGEIPAGQSARLDFKANEMNDVLKSLTVNDQSGNSVAGVRYDSSMPLASKLAEFPFKLGDRSPLTDFLDQLKGAVVEMKFGGSSFKGQIVGARMSPSRDKAQTTTETISLLLENGEMSMHDLGSATSIRLTDPELQRQLSEYLRSLNSSRSREQKSVYIDSARDAARKLSIAYTIPMPVWKSSYRLVLDGGTQKKPLLEGWAIIDNTTSEDWTRVDLSVVSGRPISFISQLYEPQYRQRQEARLDEEASVGPVLYRAAGAPPPPPSPTPMAKAMDQRVGRSMRGEMLAEASNEPIQAVMSSISVDTTAREAGDLFEYRFSQPVTVKRNESAMLPFLQQDINARKLLIYTQGNGRENPFNSAELTNSTGKTLDGGPLSVYEANTYAGEALMNTFKAGDKRLLSYAVDLGTRVVEDEDGGKNNLREIKLSQGVLTQRFVSEEVTTYKITNVDKKVKTLVIEHRLEDGVKILSPKPTESTATHHRFEVKLTGEAAQTLVVKEESTYDESVTLVSMNDEAFFVSAGSARLSPAAKQILAEMAALRRQIADSNNLVKSLNAQSSEASADQDRVRRNLASLNSVSGQQERVQKYASDLAALDQRLVDLRKQIAAETTKRDGIQRQLNEKVATANF
jgi:hypothetical protein